MLPSLLFYEISSNNGIRIYLSACNRGFGFEQKYWRLDRLAKKGTERWICTPLFTLLNEHYASLTQVVTPLASASY